jgi:hypothetical protein
MKVVRRTFLHLAAGAAALPTLPGIASSLDYALGYTPFVSTQAEFSELVAASTEKWAKVIQAANIKAE